MPKLLFIVVIVMAVCYYMNSTITCKIIIPVDHVEKIIIDDYNHGTQTILTDGLESTIGKIEKLRYYNRICEGTNEINLIISIYGTGGECETIMWSGGVNMVHSYNNTFIEKMTIPSLEALYFMEIKRCKI